MRLSDSVHVKVVVLGSAAVVLFDVIASLAARYFGFIYARAAFGSCLIYLAIGFFAARLSPSSSLGAAAAATGITGLVDASVGWAVSWMLGPGRLAEGTPLTVPHWLGTTIIVMVLAAAVGVIGGFAGRRSASSVAAA
jgi:hypothetical protein